MPCVDTVNLNEYGALKQTLFCNSAIRLSASVLLFRSPVWPESPVRSSLEGGTHPKNHLHSSSSVPPSQPDHIASTQTQSHVTSKFTMRSSKSIFQLFERRLLLQARPPASPRSSSAQEGSQLAARAWRVACKMDGHAMAEAMEELTCSALEQWPIHIHSSIHSSTGSVAISNERRDPGFDMY